MLRCHRLTHQVKLTPPAKRFWDEPTALGDALNRTSALFAAIFLMLAALSSTASAETLLIDIGRPGEVPAFHFNSDVKIGGSVELSFNHGGQGYRVVIRAAERSATERSATGLTTPKFEVALYRGGISPERLMAKVEAEYPAGDLKTSCGVHVEPGLQEAFWITLGVGLGTSPTQSCERMMQITRQMQKK
jgi:hypothetical protein